VPFQHESRDKDRLWAGRQRFQFRQKQNSSLRHNIKAGSGAHTIGYPTGTGGGGQSGRDIQLTTYIPLLSKSRTLTQCPGVYLGHPLPGGYKYDDLALQVRGVSRIGTIKYCHESSVTQTRAGLRWRVPAVTVNYRPVLSSERALQNNKPATI
jgi:hypothetical protein